MLIEFRVSNFRSFHQEQVFSLEASKDDTHPENLFPCRAFRLLKAAAIYGPNASGKSNLIKAIAFASSFVRDSATRLNQGDEIPGVVPFRLAADAAAKPSSFGITIALGETIYEYGFSVTRERVHDEWLFARPPGGRRQRWLERRFDPATKETRWAFRGSLRADRQILRERTRDNGLVLSRGAELNVKSLTEVFLWFQSKLWVQDLSEWPARFMRMTALRVQQDPAFRDRVLRLLQHAGLGVDGLSVEERPAASDGRMLLHSSLAAAHRYLLLSQLAVQTSHRMADTKDFRQFEMEEESNGTQRFFALAGPFLDALDQGAVAVLDELDCSMHPLLTRKLVEFFQSPGVNKKGAQLIFATHDSTLLDPELFRRDQIWLVEKNTRGESGLFSLYDFDTKDRPRNTEAFQRNYLAGRYGAVPKFGPIFEDLELR
jgi:predicted ATPase